MEKLDRIKLRIMQNGLVKIIYKCQWYFDLGRSSVGRYYAWLPEILIILGGIKYLLGINLSIKVMIMGVLFFVFIFSITGYIFKKTGLYDMQRYIEAERDPITHEMLASARTIEGWKIDCAKCRNHVRTK